SLMAGYLCLRKNSGCRRLQMAGGTIKNWAQDAARSLPSPEPQIHFQTLRSLARKMGLSNTAAARSLTFSSVSEHDFLPSRLPFSQTPDPTTTPMPMLFAFHGGSST